MTIKPLLKSSSKHESKTNDQQDSTAQSTCPSGSSVLRPSHRGTAALQQQKPVSELGSPQRDILTTTPSGVTTTVGSSRRRRSPQKRVHYKREGINRVVIDTSKSCKSPSTAYQLGDSIPPSCASPHATLSSPKPHNPSDALLINTGTNNNNNINITLNPPDSPNNTDKLLLPADESFSGYNSGDEHIANKEASLTLADWVERDKQFATALHERGLVLNDIAEDGACLFRSISLQIYGDQDMHEVIRNQTMDYIYKNREYFAQFVTEDITSYVLRKRNSHVHGNHIEIQAISEIYNRPVELYCYQTEPINIFNSDQLQNGYEPLRLSYQRGSHYNAIINPYKASVGVGLGLAGYSPNEPDRTQMHEAVRLSEEQEIEQTMFEDKLKTTDWEATNEAIEEQIARESYLQWCRDNMQRQKVPAQRTSVSGGGGGGGGGGVGCAGESCGGSMLMSAIGAAASSSSTVTSQTECGGGSIGLIGVVPVAASCGGGKSPRLMSDEDDVTSFGSDSELGRGSPGRLDQYTQQRPDRRRKRRRVPNATTTAEVQTSAGPSSHCSETRTFNPTVPDCTSTFSGKQPRVASFAAEDLPGTSSGTSPQKSSPILPTTSTKPSSSPPKATFSLYHELLESSFSDDLSDLTQLTEAQMLQKALQMSRMDFMQQRHTRTDSDPASP